MNATLAEPFTFAELIVERATAEETAERPVATMNGRSLTYREYARVASTWAHLFLAARDERTRHEDVRPRVAVLAHNCLEYLSAYGGAALSGGMAFALNTGLSGSQLARVLARAEPHLLVVDAVHAPGIEAVLGALPVRPEVLCIGEGGSLSAALSGVPARLGDEAFEPPRVPVGRLDPWVVIYTSGTTSEPKGIVSTHAKMRGVGIAIAGMCRLVPSDVGYLSMPIFHGSGMFQSFLPAFTAGASVALREKFSASHFAHDLFRYGATYWNYVGQPVHYVIAALRNAHGDDEAELLRAVREHPENRMRLCLGSGASARERQILKRYLGLEHVYEMYGSTEAEITTICVPSDPPDSVGEINDDRIQVVDVRDEPRPGARFDAEGHLLNAVEATGEIVRLGGTTGAFTAYHGDPDATAAKVRRGVYHSGDLGYVRELEGRRYLYFAGRTEDWIRKDGENFSAECVSEMVVGAPGVDLAVAYGVPRPAGDEWVMAAIRLADGGAFEPAAFLAHCEAQVRDHGRDRKWIPDLVRVVPEFATTETHKIRVRDLASGGTPADTGAAAHAFDTGVGNAFFSLGFTGVVGMARAFPELLDAAPYTDAGRAAALAMKDGCLAATTDGSPAPTGHFADYTTVSDPLDQPAVQEVLSTLILPRPGHAPRADLYVYHAIADELVPIASVDAMVAAYCDAGVHVRYNRIASGEHVTVAATGASDALAYLVSRLSGEDPPLVPAGTVVCN